MKALVPSGGTGSRLRPITHTSAKQLVPVANKPILFYGLESLAAAGITDVGLVVGETAAEIQAAVGDGSAWGLHVTYIRQDAPLGLAHTVLIAREFLGGDDFVMYLGDNILKGGVKAICDEFAAQKPNAQILLAQVPEPQRFGVAELDGERVVRLVEKPAAPPSDWALVGVYVFDAHIHDAVRAITPSARGELEITDAIQWLIDAGLDVRAHRIDGWWKDTGRLEDLLEANRLILEGIAPDVRGAVGGTSRIDGSVILAAGASVEGSTIRGPAVIGEGARIVDSFVGPYSSIGANCVIEDSEIEHSVIMDGCTIRGMHRLEDSLLGREVTVERGESKPKAYRLMVGDHGRVGVI
ncbi:MAG TPA: glucose-1-phosphate thymidylyltransferase [Actinomycetota bacterium]